MDFNFSEDSKKAIGVLVCLFFILGLSISLVSGADPNPATDTDITTLTDPSPLPTEEIQIYDNGNVNTFIVNYEEELGQSIRLKWKVHNDNKDNLELNMKLNYHDILPSTYWTKNSTSLQKDVNVEWHNRCIDDFDKGENWTGYIEFTLTRDLISSDFPRKQDVIMAVYDNVSQSTNEDEVFSSEGDDYSYGRLDELQYTTWHWIGTYSKKELTADTYISSSNPTINYGSESYLNVDGENRALLKFPKTMPDYYGVAQVKLYGYGKPKIDKVSVKSPQSWLEDNITYNNAVWDSMENYGTGYALFEDSKSGGWNREFNGFVRHLEFEWRDGADDDEYHSWSEVLIEDSDGNTVAGMRRNDSIDDWDVYNPNTASWETKGTNPDTTFRESEITITDSEIIYHFNPDYDSEWHTETYQHKVQDWETYRFNANKGYELEIKNMYVRYDRYQYDGDWSVIDVTDAFLYSLENFSGESTLTLGLDGFSGLRSKEYDGYAPYLKVQYYPVDTDDLEPPEITAKKPMLGGVDDYTITDDWGNSGLCSTVNLRGEIENFHTETGGLDLKFYLDDGSTLGDAKVIDYGKKDSLGLFEATVGKLAEGTTYYYRIKAISSQTGNTYWYPEDKSYAFKVTKEGIEDVTAEDTTEEEEPEPPKVTWKGIEDRTDTSLRAKCYIDLNNNSNGTLTLQYTDNDNATTFSSESISISSGGDKRIELTGLENDTKYYLRFKIEAGGWVDRTAWYDVTTRSENWNMPSEGEEGTEIPSYDIKQLPELISAYTGIEPVVSSMLLSAMILMAISSLVLCIMYVWGNANVNPTAPLLVFNLSISGVLIYLTWLPIWIPIILIIALALLWGYRMKPMGE